MITRQGKHGGQTEVLRDIRKNKFSYKFTHFKVIKNFLALDTAWLRPLSNRLFRIFCQGC